MRRGPYCLASPPHHHPPLIVKPAKIFPSQCAGDWAEFFFSLPLSLSYVFPTFLFFFFSFISVFSGIKQTRLTPLVHPFVHRFFLLSLAFCPISFFSAGVQVKSQVFCHKSKSSPNFICIAGQSVHAEISPHNTFTSNYGNQNSASMYTI